MTDMIVGMMGGLSLFLYGMRMMSTGLEKVAGNKMKTILEKLTSNKFVSILVGAAVTALVQSSSATTVMLVTFVNSGIMTLEQAIWIIMGANIGATCTNLMIALNISDIAAVMAMIGVIMVVFIKNQKSNDVGTIIAGMGILFIGMGIMSESVTPLRSMPEFANFMATFTNPILGILGGAGITAIIQSSSATIGILQAMSTTGAITMSNSIYLLFGTNIGTCVTAALASLGGNKDARRTASLHLMFNVISTIIFTVGIQFIPFVAWIESTSPIVKNQIANANTVYKVVATIILLPFGTKMVQLSRKLIRGEDDKRQSLLEPINPSRTMGAAAVVTRSLRVQTEYMVKLVQKNMELSMAGLLNHDTSHMEELYKTEVLINEGRDDVTDYMDEVSKLRLHHHDSEVCMSLFKMSTDLERLGDHAKNLMEFGLEEQLNPEAIEELKELDKMMKDAFRYITNRDISVDIEAANALTNIEKSVNELTAQYRDEEVKRLKEGKCSYNNAVVYTNILVDIERIFDHLNNILEECQKHHFTLFDPTETPAVE